MQLIIQQIWGYSILRNSFGKKRGQYYSRFEHRLLSWGSLGNFSSYMSLKKAANLEVSSSHL